MRVIPGYKSISEASSHFILETLQESVLYDSVVTWTWKEGSDMGQKDESHGRVGA
jgi:hypothetical protein